MHGFDTSTLTGTKGPLAGLTFGLTPQGWWVRSVGGKAIDYIAAMTDDGDINIPLSHLGKLVSKDVIDELLPILAYAKTENPLTWIPNSRHRYGSESDWAQFIEQTEWYGYREVLEDQAKGQTLILGACAEVVDDGAQFWDWRRYRREVTAANLDDQLRSLWLQLTAAQGRGQRIMIPETLLSEMPEKQGSHNKNGGITPAWGTMWLDIDVADGHDKAGTGVDQEGRRFLTDAEAFDLVTLALDKLIGVDVGRTIVHSGGGYQAHIVHPKITEQVRKDFGVFWEHYGKFHGVSIDSRGGLRRTPLRVWGSYRIKDNTTRRIEVVQRDIVNRDTIERDPFKTLRHTAEMLMPTPAPRAEVKTNIVETDTPQELKPGQRLALAVPAIEMLDALHSVEVTGARFGVWRPDGTKGRAADNAILSKYDEDLDAEIDTVFFHDNGDAAALGLVAGYHVSSYDILTTRCGGDKEGASLAALVIRRFDFDWNAIVAYAKQNVGPKEIRKNLPSHKKVVTGTTEERFNAIPGVLERLAAKFAGRSSIDGAHLIVGIDRLLPSEVVTLIIAGGDQRKANQLMTNVLGASK